MWNLTTAELRGALSAAEWRRLASREATWAKERRNMAKKAADADGGSRATKSSVH